MSYIQRTATSEGITRITLDRPEKLNSFFGTMREELIDTLETIAADREIRVVILTGAGRAFCAGGDVEAMSKMQQERETDRFANLLELGKRIVTTVRTMPQIVIAAVNGVAAGAGCNLALSADYRIGSTDAKFSQSFVKIGLHPDWGGTHFLPAIVGTSKAIEILTTGRMIESEEALSLGLLDRVVAPGQLLAEAESLAAAIAAGPRDAIRDIKRAVHASRTNPLEMQLDLEKENQIRAFESEESAEGMRAFFEKRSPKFRR